MNGNKQFASREKTAVAIKQRILGPSPLSLVPEGEKQ
jgi:hypothetical protein